MTADGRLNRARLAELAFRDGRLQELNAIVHPPVIEAQQRWMDEVFARDPAAVAVIESALIFEVVRDARARGEKDERARRLAPAHRPHHRGDRAGRAEDRPLCRARVASAAGANCANRDAD